MNSHLKPAPETITHHDLTYELVDSIPPGYMIWNIGENMLDGYLPLCRLSRYQPFPGGRNIERDTLKAIRFDGAQTILAAVGGGQRTIEQMEAFLRDNCNAQPGSWTYAQLGRIRKALPLMRQLKWQ